MHRISRMHATEGSREFFFFGRLGATVLNMLWFRCEGELQSIIAGVLASLCLQRCSYLAIVNFRKTVSKLEASKGFGLWAALEFWDISGWKGGAGMENTLNCLAHLCWSIWCPRSGGDPLGGKESSKPLASVWRHPGSTAEGSNPWDPC